MTPHLVFRTWDHPDVRPTSPPSEKRHWTASFVLDSGEVLEVQMGSESLQAIQGGVALALSCTMPSQDHPVQEQGDPLPITPVDVSLTEVSHASPLPLAPAMGLQHAGDGSPGRVHYPIKKAWPLWPFWALALILFVVATIRTFTTLFH